MSLLISLDLSLQTRVTLRLSLSWWVTCALKFRIQSPGLHQLLETSQKRFTCAPSIFTDQSCINVILDPFHFKHVERLPFWFLVLKLQQNPVFHASLQMFHLFRGACLLAEMRIVSGWCRILVRKKGLTLDYNLVISMDEIAKVVVQVPASGCPILNCKGHIASCCKGWPILSQF